MHVVGILSLAGLLAGCVSQSEMALSKNVYKIDVDARGLIAMGVARGQIQQRVAESTISKGYTHYIIQQAGSQNGSIYAGRTPVYANTSVNVIGNTAYANTTYTGGQPMVMPTSQTSVIVAMFKAPNIPADAIDAEAIIKGAKK